MSGPTPKRPRRRPPASPPRRPADALPDVRDGLNRLERAILVVLFQTQAEGRAVPTAMLYGRVLELVDVSQEEFQAALSRMARRARGGLPG